jgi:parallel beta-helix repeat protein
MKPNTMLNMTISVLLVWMMFSALLVGLIQFTDEVQGATIIVPVDYSTIQEAIDAAFPLDTIEVWDGVYVENLNVNKTVTLIGNSSATTIINGNMAGDVVRITSDWVNITGFSMINGSSNGINADSSSYTKIEDCNITSNNGAGVYFYSSDKGTIRNSDISFNNGGGIYLQDWSTRDNSIENCNLYNNSWVGIYMTMGASNTQIIGTNISGHVGGYGIFSDNTNNLLINDTKIWQNDIGIYLDISNYVTVDGSDIYSNFQYGIYMWGNNNIIKNCNIMSNVFEGIRLFWSSNLGIENTVIENHSTGINAQGVKNAKVTNSSIVNCTTDIYLQNDSDFDLLNTTFNKSRVSYFDLTSSITVRWFMHVYVNDSIGNPIPGARVIVRNATYIGVFDGVTDSFGYANWIIVTEYFENQTLKWFYSAHNITGHDGILFGWAKPEANMTGSKVVVVTLASPMPVIDFIVIEDAIGGNSIGNMVYRIEDEITFYAVAYNNTVGFIGPVPATWSSNNTGVGDVIFGPSSSTTFTAFVEGACFVSAVNGSVLDTTGVLTIIWLVENLDQSTVHPTIQKAINAANPGDRLLAKSWTYYENVIVNKTVTLMGTDKSTTVVHGGGISDALQVAANWVNITGFSFIGGGSGVGIYNVLNTKIEDCLFYSNKGFGIYVGGSEDTIIYNNEIHSNEASGIFLQDFFTRNTNITATYIHDNQGYGIRTDMNVRRTEISFCNISDNGVDGINMWSESQSTIRNSNIWNNYNGITLEGSNSIEILDSNIFSNSQSGVRNNFGGGNNKIINCNITSNNQEGVYLSGAWNFEIIDTNIVNHTYGIWAQGSSISDIYNSSIVNSNPATDIYLTSNSMVSTLNTSFNKSSTNITDSASELTVKWFMHVLVEDFVGQPISGAEVFVQDSNGALVKSGFAEVDGSLRWIVVTEYIENQTLKTFYTPHIATATIASDIVSDSITMDNSKFMVLQLSSLQPAVELQLVAGLQYSNINVDYDILASVTQGNKPRMHTLDTVISIEIYDDDMNLVVQGDQMILLDSDLGLYSYSNITTGSGVYFVVATLTASGITGIGLTSFEVVDWIEDISNVNDSIGQISDVVDYLNQTSDTINSTLDSLNNQLTGVNDSIMNQLSVMETNLLDKLKSLNETNILSFLQGMNDTLFTEIQSLLASITDDIIGMNGSLSDELTSLLNSLTSDNNALQSWLDIVLKAIDSNLTNAETVLTNKIDDINTSMTTFNSNLLNDLAGIVSSIQLHDNKTADNHSQIVSDLNNIISGGTDEVDLSELKAMLTNLALNLSTSNESLASDLMTISDDISSFENQMAQDLDQVNAALQDLDDIQNIITKLNNLNTNLTTGNDQLEEKIDQIPKEKGEEEEGFGLTQILLILVLVLVLINLLVMLLGRKKGGSQGVLPEEKAESRESPSKSEDAQKEPGDESFELDEDGSEIEDETLEEEEDPLKEFIE